MKRIILFINLLLIAFLFSYCSESNEVPEEKAIPKIFSFSPTVGQAGDKISVTGSGFGQKLSDVSIEIDGVSMNASSLSPDNIEFTLNATVPSGFHQLKVKVGNNNDVSEEYFKCFPNESITDQEVLNFNYTIGTQTIGPVYGHTTNDRLVETANAINEMGSNIIKINLNSASYNLNGSSQSTKLKDMVRDVPSFKKVFDMPFTYYFLWARSNADWKDGYSRNERMADSTDISELTSYLLNTYNNSGKQFFIGHWEGDWYLLDNYNTSANPSDKSCDEMIKWLTTRQNAVNYALKNTVHSNVGVFTYTEVNRVVDAMNGKTRVVNRVLPSTNVDYVSYSAYDAQELSQSAFNNTLDYIESNLPKSSSVKGKRVFIGEIGIPAFNVNYSKEMHAQANLDLMKKAINWGAPFVLYWQMYNNELQNGTHKGFWLIDEKNKRWPLYYAFGNFNLKAQEWVNNQKRNSAKLPAREEFINWASKSLK